MVLLTSRRIDPVSFFIDEPFFRLGTRNAPKTASTFPLVAGPDDPHPATAAGHAATEKPVRVPETAFRTDTGGSVSGSPAVPRCPAPSFLRFRRPRTRSAVSRRHVPGSTRRKRNGRRLPSATGRGDVWQSTGHRHGSGPAKAVISLMWMPGDNSDDCSEKNRTVRLQDDTRQLRRGLRLIFRPVRPRCFRYAAPPRLRNRYPVPDRHASPRYGTVRRHRRRLPKYPTRGNPTTLPTPLEAPHTRQPDDTATDSRNTDRNSVQLPPVTLSVRINLFSTPRRPYLSHRNRQSTSGRTVPPHPAGRNLRQRTKHRYGQPILPFMAPHHLPFRKNRPPSLSFLRPSAPDTPENLPVPRTHVVRETGRSILISPDPVPSPNHPLPDDRNAQNDQRSAGKPLTELLPGRELPYAHQYRHHTEKDGRPITIHDIRYHKHRIGDHQCGPEPEPVIFHGIRF